MNKLEAADKLAEAVADDLEVDIQETHDKMDLALCDYLNAPPCQALSG